MGQLITRRRITEILITQKFIDHVSYLAQQENQPGNLIFGDRNNTKKYLAVATHDHNTTGVDIQEFNDAKKTHQENPLLHQGGSGWIPGLLLEN